MIKLVYAESALPGVSRLAFLRRWRTHGAFAMTHPGFWDHVVRYVHNDPLPDSVAFAGARGDYDALGEIVFADETTMQQALSSEDLVERVRGDGAHTFARTRTINAMVEEVTARDRGHGSHTVMAFVPGTSSTAAPQLRRHVDSLQRQLLAGDGPFGSLTCAALIDPAIDDGAAYQVVLEMQYHSVHDAVQAYAQWRPAFDAALDGATGDGAAGDDGAVSNEMVVLAASRSVLYDEAALGLTRTAATTAPGS